MSRCPRCSGPSWDFHHKTDTICWEIAKQGGPSLMQNAEEIFLRFHRTRPKTKGVLRGIRMWDPTETLCENQRRIKGGESRSKNSWAYGLAKRYNLPFLHYHDLMHKKVLIRIAKIFILSARGVSIKDQAKQLQITQGQLRHAKYRYKKVNGKLVYTRGQ